MFGLSGSDPGQSAAVLAICDGDSAGAELLTAAVFETRGRGHPRHPAPALLSSHLAPSCQHIPVWHRESLHLRRPHTRLLVQSKVDPQNEMTSAMNKQMY